MNAKYLLRRLILVFFIAIACKSVIAQQPMNYWRNPETMIQDQASLIFEQVHKVLVNNPPSVTTNDERKLALFSIDVLLHDNRLDNSKVFYEYVEKSYQNVVDKLGNEKPKADEVRIYRLYNHGFVVQSSSVTVGIDIIRGGREESPFVSESLMQSLVSLCDILFISHEHSDHTDKSVIQMFFNQQKNVIVAVKPEALESIPPQMKYLRGENVLTELLNIQAKNKTLTVKVFPGHQDAMPNNVYAITMPEGITVIHTGDQSNPGDMNWITRISEEIKVDVLLVHSWMPEIEKAVEGIKPKLVIVGHENEMGHTIDHRESYWLTFRRMANIKVPYIVMAWGESYDVTK